MAFKAPRVMPAISDTMRANGAISKYHFVTITSQSDGYCAQCGSANAIVHGVSLDDAADQELVSIALAGIVPVVADTAITKGVRVMSNNEGHAVTLAQSGYSAGLAWEAADADGDYVEILLQLTNYLMA